MAIQIDYNAPLRETRRNVIFHVNAMISEIWYIGLERFGPSDGENWSNYIKWSKLRQLRELVSLDGILCPPVVTQLIEEDWNYNVHADYLCNFFIDLEYLLRRVAPYKNVQILAVSKGPIEMRSEIDREFNFCGYDLIEKGGSTSALCNCGGFPESFSDSELSEQGLILTLARAKEVQRDLVRNNPEESHADCDIWEIWRMEYNNRVDDTVKGVSSP